MAASSTVNVGPRQPWHDIHSKVEGPIAYDVFLNFYERWTKLHESHQDQNALDFIVEEMDTDGPLTIKSGEDWNCQFFRSITDCDAGFILSDNKHLVSTIRIS